MPTVVLSPIGGPGQQFFDNNGDVLAGGLLYTYLAGTTGPQDTYTDHTGSTPQPNPVVLDSAGRPPDDGLWLVSAQSYKFVLQTSLGVPVVTWDNIIGSTDSLVLFGELASLTAISNQSAQILSDIANCFVNAQRITSNQVLAAASTTALLYNGEVTDLGNNFDPATGIFTAPATGNYQISATAAIIPNAAPNVGAICTLGLYLTSGIIEILDWFVVPAVTITEYMLKGSIPVHMAAGDTAQVKFTTATAVAWNFQAQPQPSYFKIARIS